MSEKLIWNLTITQKFFNLDLSYPSSLLKLAEYKTYYCFYG